MDLGLGSRELLIKTLKYILLSDSRVRTVSDAAFAAVDTDCSGYLQKEEIGAVLENVVRDFAGREAPNVDSIFSELDRDGDGRVSQEQFVTLIRQVLGRLLEHAGEKKNL